MTIDMHCHLDRYANPRKIALEAEAGGVSIVAMTNLPSHFMEGRTPAASLKNVRLSLGLHPMLAPHSESELRLFAQFVSTTSYIGEVGLDFSKEGIATKSAQLESFDFVLRQIAGKGKVISLHSRKAEEAVLDRLLANGVTTAVFHWFSGERMELDRLTNAGHFISVNGAMLRSPKGRQHVKLVSRSNILLETDGPYAKVFSRPSKPIDVLQTLGELAILWHCSPDEAVAQIASNFRLLVTRLESECRTCPFP